MFILAGGFEKIKIRSNLTLTPAVLDLLQSKAFFKKPDRAEWQQLQGFTRLCERKFYTATMHRMIAASRVLLALLISKIVKWQYFFTQSFYDENIL